MGVERTITYHDPRRPKVKATNGSEDLKLELAGLRPGISRSPGWGWVMLVREACMISMDYRKLTHQL